MTLNYEDLMGHLWDPRKNHEISVIKIISGLDPRAYNVDPKVWRDTVREACDAWEKSGICAFVISFQPEYDGPDFPDGTILIVDHELDDYHPDLDPRGLSNAYVEWKSKLATSGLVWIDPEALTPNAAPALRYTVCHEIGHILGLAHRTTDSIMAGGASLPTEADFTILRELYG